MLFNKKFFALSALITLAAATALPGGGGRGSGGGGSDEAQCCEQVEKASHPAAAGILAVLGVIVQDINVLVGINCSPITVIGNGPCSGTEVTCTDNSHGNIIQIGCIPVTV